MRQNKYLSEKNFLQNDFENINFLYMKMIEVFKVMKSIV